jgi:hypothetical protein
MANLDFIVDDEFRESLTRDLAELDRALENSNLKSAHVLAGSIVEAVLIDYLIAENIVTREIALKFDLAAAIDKCRAEQVITGKTADLCSVVRAYRNLIHPGRAVRLEEKVDKNTARVCESVVIIVLDEIAELRLRSYGLTAQQIVSKLERDSGADAILTHLLKDVKPREVEKLLLKVLPECYLKWHGAHELVDLPHPQFLQLLTSCFRKALKQSSDDVKARAIERFAEILRTESNSTIELYGNAFFRTSDLKYAQPGTVSLIKAHLLARLKTSIATVLPLLKGIGSSLVAADAANYIDPFIRAVHAKTISIQAAREFIAGETGRTTAEFDTSVANRLNDLEKLFTEKQQPELFDVVKSLRAAADWLDWV